MRCCVYWDQTERARQLFLTVPQAGEISLCGRNINEMSGKEIAAAAGYVPQLHTPAFDYTVADFVLMGSAPRVGMFAKPKESETIRTYDALARMGIAHLADRSYMEISGGERQQALIARSRRLYCLMSLQLTLIMAISIEY